MHLTIPLQLLLPLFSLLPLLPLLPATRAADTKAPPKPCTIHSPATGSYYDLQPLDLSLHQNPKSKDSRTDSWHSRGYDYPSNFTLNICGPVIEPLEDVVGIASSQWKDVGAFYRDEKNKTYSLGHANSELVFRGRKLLLNYTHGSPCPDLDKDGNPKLRSREIIHDPEEDDKKGHRRPSHDAKPSASNRYKSTLISLLCDRDPILSTHPSIAFLGSLDHCVYVFEARSRYFCGGAASAEPGSLGPGGVFGVIIVITVLAYLVGGCAYQRVVMRQRGWRQCPNYAVWAGLVEGVQDMFTIIFSSCTRHLPSFSRAFNSRSGGGGYHRVGADSGRRRGANGNAAVSPSVIGRGRPTGETAQDDENRLIDQLDEEWDD